MGMKLRLAFSIAIHTQPEILIYDELHLVWDANFNDKYTEWLKTNKSNMARLVITHDVSKIADQCDRILVLHKGITVYQGDDVERGIECYQSP